VLRFAPSPNGYLHLGHAYSALLNAKLARETAGRFLLRIEDIDIQRSRAAYVDAIFEDLAWLGLEWETPVIRQSARFALYAEALSRLDCMGHVYCCTCTRLEISNRARQAEANGERPWPRDPDGAVLYPGTCRAQRAIDSLSKPFVQRLALARAIEAAPHPLTAAVFLPELPLDTRTMEVRPQAWGDVVLSRKDTPGSYHLCVVLDDAVQGVSHIVRGQDLEPATGIHRLLQILLGLPAPAYHHHKLIVDDAGAKLSKNLRSRSLRSLREEGATPLDIKRLLGFGSS
jgi:glutamyl-Q tRNA(Asp) synthetase